MCYPSLESLPKSLDNPLKNTTSGTTGTPDFELVLLMYKASKRAEDDTRQLSLLEDKHHLHKEGETLIECETDEGQTLIARKLF